jgi:hypothetical protein
MMRGSPISSEGDPRRTAALISRYGQMPFRSRHAGTDPLGWLRTGHKETSRSHQPPAGLPLVHPVA